MAVRAFILPALASLVILAAPLGAQEASAPTPSPAPSASNVTVIPAPMPMLVRGHPRRAEVERAETVDIPQWAKDEGHNGTATYFATVAPDGMLSDLTLKTSSNSPAIDAAAESRARQLRYTPATDGSGEKIEGKVEVRLGYARYDADSPGGGLDDYTCADMLREAEWFRANSEGFRKVFWLQNAYLSLPALARLNTGEIPGLQERERQREAQREKWDKLAKRCAKSPDRLFLDIIPGSERDFYRTVVDSF